MWLNCLDVSGVDHLVKLIYTGSYSQMMYVLTIIIVNYSQMMKNNYVFGVDH